MRLERLKVLDDLLTPERLKLWSVLLILIYAATVIGWALTIRNGVDFLGQPFGFDFLTFYTASDLALHGKAALAYDPAQIRSAEAAILPKFSGLFLWHYPPTFQVLVLPLALLPYSAAYLAWLGGLLALYAGMIRAQSDHPLAVKLALAFPAVLVCGLPAQNGFLSAALIGFSLALLDRRPFVAGMIGGLMIYKPHLAVLFPVLLIAGGYWRALAGAGLSAAAFAGASLLALGLAPWRAFFHNIEAASAVLASGSIPWEKIPSVFVAAAWLGLPHGVAYALHGAVAATVIAMTALSWRGQGPRELKGALAVLATLSVSPYVFDYDLVLLAIPIALVAEYGRKAPLPVGTKAALMLAFATPVLFRWFAKHTHLQLMPAAVLLTYAAVWRVHAQALAARIGPRRATQAEPVPLTA